jgi:hypothetical protein
MSLLYNFWRFIANLASASFPSQTTHHSATQKSSMMALDDLNDDVLLVIFSFVDQIQDRASESEGLGYLHRPNTLTAIKSLSLTNKRIRSLTMPWLFRTLVLNDGDWSQTSNALKVIGSCSEMTRYARYILQLCYRCWWTKSAISSHIFILTQPSKLNIR